MTVLVLAISAPMTMILWHVLLQRTIFSAGEPRARLKLVIRIILGVMAIWGVLTIAVLSWLPLPLLFLNTAYVMVVSFGLGMCYFNVFALSETALRIRLLTEFYLTEKWDDTGRSRGTIREYDAATMIRVRINRLLAMGAAREQNGKILMVSAPLVMTSKLFHLARLAWRAVLFGLTPEDITSG